MAENTALLRKRKTVVLAFASMIDREVDPNLLIRCEMRIVEDPVISFRRGFIFKQNEQDLLWAFNKNLAEIQASGDLQNMHDEDFSKLLNYDCTNTAPEAEGYQTQTLNGVCLLTLGGMVFGPFFQLASKLHKGKSNAISARQGQPAAVAGESGEARKARETG
jgi:hypothetical protein